MQPTTVLDAVMSGKASGASIHFPEHRRYRASALLALDVVADAVAACLSMLLSFRLYLNFVHEGHLRQAQHPEGAILILASTVVFVLARSGAYRGSGGLLGIRETACILKACFYTSLIMVVAALSSGDRGAAKFVAIELPILVVLLFLEKHAMHLLAASLRQRGFGMQRVLIYGAGAPGRMLYSALIRSPKLGLWPVAIIDDDDAHDGVRIHASSYRKENHIICAAADFRASLLRSHQAEVVIVATRSLSREALDAVREESAKAGAEVVFAADLGEKDGSPVEYIDIDGQLLYSTHALRPRYLYDAVMRAFELVLSGIAILLSSVLLGAIALMVRMDSPGPILFRQRRVGMNGRLFTIFKFRTMRAESCGDGISPTSAADGRITRIGRWLRKTSLDELPQLFNVVLGDMALVGPRPEMPFIVAEYTEEQRRRLAVKPGLTGLWQLSADRSSPIHENIHYDLYYLKERSISVDLAILIHTAFFAMNGT